MIAYFILIHRFPEQFKRMFRAIHAPGNSYVVHVDRQSGPALAQDIAAFLKPYANTAILDAQDAQWGGYSLVDAELRGMAKLLQMDSNWRYYINLSGQDFPLKTQAHIRDFLTAHDGTQFIRAVDQRKTRPDTMNRLDHVWIEAFARMFETIIPRAFLRRATPYIGTQWKAVTRDFCAFVCHDKAADRFKRFYKRSFIADEGFFQTVLMNAYPGAVSADDDLRTIDWIPDGAIKLRPRTFVARDAPRLMRSADLFARKFNAEEDSVILDMLEAHLTTQGAAVSVKPELAAAAA